MCTKHFNNKEYHISVWKNRIGLPNDSKRLKTQQEARRRQKWVGNHGNGVSQTFRYPMQYFGDGPNFFLVATTMHGQLLKILLPARWRHFPYSNRARWRTNSWTINCGIHDHQTLTLPTFRVYIKAFVYYPKLEILEDLMANIEREINKISKKCPKKSFWKFWKRRHLVVTAEGRHISLQLSLKSRYHFYLKNKS